MAKLRKQSQTAHPLPFLLLSSTDGTTPVTGLGSAPVVTLSKDGGSFASAAGAVSETGNGWYKVAGNATDCGTLGALTLHATGTGAQPTDSEFQVVGFDPDVAYSTLGGVAQTGDAYAYLGTNLGLLGANATALAPASTALSTANWTTARAAKLDNLDVASSTLATAANLATLSTSVNNLNNLSALANLFGPSTLVRPSSGSVVYPLTFVVRDSEGHAIDVDTNTVTLTATNAAGTDRSANLSAVTHSGTGEYTFTYTVATAHADEGLRITAAGTVQSATRKAYLNADVADADSLAALAAIQAQTDKLTFAGSNLQADVQTIKGQTVTATGAFSFDSQTAAQGTIATNLNATVGSRMATYTQPTGFLAAAFPATVASPTNITGGTITTVTNLTNAPTSGDLTAAMKTSVGTVVVASAVASVTGAVTVGGYSAGQDPATLVLDGAAGIETGWTVRQAVRTILRILGGKSSNSGATIRDMADSKNAVTASVDSSGNRTAVTIDNT